MPRNDIRFVDFYRAPTAQEAMRLKLLFDRAGISYMVHDELISTHVLPVPIRFKVLENQLALAQAQLESAFELSPESIPDRCPRGNARR